MPMLSALRKLSVSTLLGPEKEKQVNWYLRPENFEKLLSQFVPQLDKIAQIIQHYAISELVVIQDMLRVFVIRVACQKSESFSVLLRPIFSWIKDHVYELPSLSDMDAYKVYRYLDFVARLLEHPRAKALLLKEGAIQVLTRVLDRCLATNDTADGTPILAGRSSVKAGFPVLSWCVPVFKSFSLISITQASLHRDLHRFTNVGTQDSIMILKYLLRFCQVLSSGKELLACLTAFKELGSCGEGRNALAAAFYDHIAEDREAYGGVEQDGNDNSNLNEFKWRSCPPLLYCCKTLLGSADLRDALSSYAIEAVSALCVGVLWFCHDGERLNSERVISVKFLFGLPDEIDSTNGGAEENLKYIHELISKLKTLADKYVADSDIHIHLHEVLESAKVLLMLLQTPSSLLNMNDIFYSDGVPIPPNVVFSSKIHLISDDGTEMIGDDLYQGALGDKFQWECPDTLPDRLSQSNLSGKRKMSSLDGQNRRARGENSVAETTNQNAFARGLGSTTASSGPTRRDSFRQRKPNTSRPPSMHVDDYVARERNDGVSNSNVIAVQRVGSSGGRPPSMHVDEFMARQRERQNPLSTVFGDATAQVKSATPVNDYPVEKLNKPKKLKADLDDEIQIDIIFDGEECEPDDKLPFPQPDDTLQQSAPVLVEQNSPHSFVEETESDIHSTPLVSNMDDNAQSEFSSRMSVSRPERPLAREPSVSSDKNYFERSDESKNPTVVKASGGLDSTAAANSSRFPVFGYNNSSGSSAQLPVDSRMIPHNFFPKNSSQQAGNVPIALGSQVYPDPRCLSSQPPLPSPSTSATLFSQTSDTNPSQSSSFLNSMNEGHHQPSTTYQIHSDYPSVYNNGSSSRSSISSPSGAARLQSPLPPAPFPYSSNPYNSTPKRTSQSTVYNQKSGGTTELPQGSNTPSGARVNTYSSPSPVSHMVFNRPGSNSMTIYGHVPTQLQSDNSNMLLGLSVPQSSMQSIHAGGQLQPLQPPQLPCPPQPPQHLRPPTQASQYSEQSQLQSPVQMHSLQMLQQPVVSPMQAYYQSQQQEFTRMHQQVDYSQQQLLPRSGKKSSHEQQDPAMSLQEYFKSPEAIQSLLSDREKLCQVLEQHPKLMQMLQEKLGAQL